MHKEPRPNAAAEALVAQRLEEILEAQRVNAALVSQTDEYGCTCNGERNFCKACADTVKTLAAGNNVHKKADGNLLILADGSARYLTFWESVKYCFFGKIPNV